MKIFNDKAMTTLKIDERSKACRRVVHMPLIARLFQWIRQSVLPVVLLIMLAGLNARSANASGYWEVSFKVGGYTVSGDKGTPTTRRVGPETLFNPGHPWWQGTIKPGSDMVLRPGTHPYYGATAYLANGYYFPGYSADHWHIVRKVTLYVTPIMTWVGRMPGDSTDVPLEAAPAYASAEVTATAGVSAPIATSSATASNGWGAPSSEPFGGDSGQQSSSSTKTIVRRVNGGGQVNLDSIVLRSGFDIDYYTASLSGSTGGHAQATVNVKPFTLDLAANVQGVSGFINNSRDEKECDAMARLAFYTDLDPELPVKPFWSGKADFGVSAIMPDYHSRNIFEDPKYLWTTTPDVYIPELDPERQFPPTFDLWTTIQTLRILDPLAQPLFGPSQGLIFGPTESAENPYDTRLRALLPQPSEPAKTFHWNFSAEPTMGEFPVTTTTKVRMSEKVGGTIDPAKPKELRGKVTIHWHTVWEDAGGGEAPTTVFTEGALVRMADNTFSKDDDVLMTKPIQNVVVGDIVYRDGVPADEADWKWNVQATETVDGTVKLTLAIHFDPDDEAGHGNMEQAQIDEQIKKVNLAYAQAIHDGAKGVELGLTLYKEVAAFYLYGPFYELGGVVLFRAAAKASELLQAAFEAGQIASRLNRVLTVQKALLPKLRLVIGQVGRTAGEDAQLAKQIVDLEKVIAKEEKAVVDLTKIQQDATKLANSTKATKENVELAKEAHATQGGISVFRIQQPNTFPITVRFLVGPNGEISIQGSKMIFINVSQEERALEFAAQRGPDSVIVHFEVSPEFVRDLRGAAVKEARKSESPPGTPLQVDWTKAADQYGIPEQWFQKLLDSIVPGSGRIIQP